MQLFGFESYREYIRYRINAGDNARGYQRRMAEAAHCQPSYISQVLSQKANLTLEQAIGLCILWEFDPMGTDYFLNLVNFERAGNDKLKKHYRKLIERTRNEKQKLSERFSGQAKIMHGEEVFYYATWYIPVIHTLLAIPGEGDPNKIAKRLSIDIDATINAIERLIQMGLVERKNGLLSLTNKSIHLQSDSPMNHSYHTNIRNLASRSLQQSRPGMNLHYSAIYSLSKEDAAKLKQQLIDAISKQRSTVVKSEEEVVAVCGIDFFEI